ncbi:MAG: nucleoside monophosphate kinase [bacterium]|nr:nucleoside monophosphate kinase [bacterium]
METESLTILVVFGPQGSGKSTQVERLAERLDLKVFEAGEVLRARAQVDEKIHQTLQHGELVDDKTMLGIIDEFIAEHRSTSGYVFDGYPRNRDQFNDLLTLTTNSRARTAGIFINLSDASAKQRLAGRFTLVGGQRVTREDDQPEIVQKRLETFKSETLPLKELFAQNFALLEIDGEPSADEVTKEIDEAVDKFLDS